MTLNFVFQNYIQNPPIIKLKLIKIKLNQILKCKFMLFRTWKHCNVDMLTPKYISLTNVSVSWASWAECFRSFSGACWGYDWIRMMNIFLLDCHTSIKNKVIYTMEKSLHVCQIKWKRIHMLCPKIMYHLIIFLGIRNVFSSRIK